MNRKDFISSCGMTCLGVFALGLALPACGTSRMVTAEISGSDLLVPLSAFETGKEKGALSYVVVQNELLQYPICVFRLEGQQYSAVLMQCTHQGAELQAFGDRLLCPAHGSEFTKTGEVQSGPADQPLRRFPVIIEPSQLRLSLK